MSALAGVFGVQHNPLLWRTLDQPDDPQLVALRAAFDETGARLRALRPDVVVMVATDHLTQWFYDNMPAFMIGKAAQIPATFANEEREFGIPEAMLRGDPEFAAWLLNDGIARGVDYAASDEFRVDHSVLVPMHFLVPELDVPIVVVFTNCIAPPLPPPSRFFAVGQALGESIRSCPLDRRVVVVASGHLSTEVGGPRHFSGPPDPEFDAHAVELVRSGLVDELLRQSTFERLLQAGNVTHQFLNFVLAMGAADGVPATHAELRQSRFASCPFFEWVWE